MSKAKEELEAIVDLMYEWSVKYGEDYLTASIIDGCGMADVDTESPLYEEICIQKYYETPAAGTAGESR